MSFDYEKSLYTDDLRAKKLLNPFIIPNRESEAGYFRWRQASVHKQIRLYFIVSGLVLLFFGAMDLLFLTGPLKSLFLVITFLGIGPVYLAAFIIFKIGKNDRLCEFFIFLSMFTASIGSVAIVILAKIHLFGFLYPVLILLVLLSYFVSSLPYLYSFITSVSTVVLFFLDSLATGQFQAGPTDDIIFLLLATAVASVGGFHLEQSSRSRYLQSEDLNYLAGHDCLTGLHNRRYFFDAAETRWNQCRREQLPLTLMIADIDFFKQYNDLYGHVEGDTCLRKVSGVFDSCVKRPFDIVARYGGEEFIFFWYDADFDYIQEEIHKIVARIESLGIEHRNSGVSESVTISTGAILIVPFDSISLKTAVRKADECLYRAKQEGRNRCVISRQYTGERADRSLISG